MRRKVSWVDVLNEQTRWVCRAQFQGWFDELAGRPTNLLDGTIESFTEALGYMRRSVANLHFNEPVDLMWLDTQLKTVSLGLLHHQGAQEGNDSQLPRFRARVKGMIDSDLLRAVKDTLLVQFAEYVGDTLDGTGLPVASRCEGMVRTKDARPLSKDAAYCQEMEQRFRQEIPAIERHDTAEGGLERCPNIYLGNGKTRFCSDTCRFATLQIAKQSEEPATLSAKQQRRFRRREKQAEPSRQDETAL